MELEEMKSLWNEMSVKIERQKKITDSLVIKITGATYRKKVSKLMVPEAVGALVCLVSVIFIVVNFYKLNTWYLLVCGITAALILFLLPVLSIKAIFNIRSVNISENNYKQSLLAFSKSKIQFVFVQKLSFYLGAILLLVILPVAGKLIYGKDLFSESMLWIWYSIEFLFFYPFSKWVFKNYLKTTIDAENILKDLEQ